MKIFSWIILAVAATVGVYGGWFVVGMYLQTMSGTDFTIRIQITLYYFGIMAMLSILYLLVRPAKVAPPPPPEEAAYEWKRKNEEVGQGKGGAGC